jgi:simple sugar transport system ATP-binding protein
MWASRVLFLDEPTAALGVRQTRNVLDLIRRVADRGVAVVLISHNMPEVLEVSDRVEVLRLGSRVARFRGADVTVEQLVGAMTGALEHHERPGAPA